jgi:hypothetical protein
MLAAIALNTRRMLATETRPLGLMLVLFAVATVTQGVAVIVYRRWSRVEMIVSTVGWTLVLITAAVSMGNLLRS